MKYHWLHCSDSTDTLLFMAGWGMGPEPFIPLDSGGLDVLMVHDYRKLDDLDIAALLPRQGRVHLLAWSMGVWAAASLLQGIEFASATALGGTLRPVDDRRGIPVRVFDETIEKFSTQVLEDFYGAMFDDTAESARFTDSRPRRSLAELRDELRVLRAAAEQQPPPGDIYTRRLVTGRDRIFPARNQVRAWGRDNCTVLPLPHFPWYRHASWAGLLELTTHD
jgi:biotin synthesis protein BioG